MGKQWKQCQTLFFLAPKSLQMVTAAMKLKDTSPWKESYDQPRQHIIKQRLYFANKGSSSQSYSFSSSHVWIWELEYKESWALKNWCFYTMVLEKTLESPLDCKEIKPVNPKGNQFWIVIERTDVEAEAPILWPLCLLLLLLRHFGRVRLCVTPETAAHQAPLSLGFSRQEHWNGFAISFSNVYYSWQEFLRRNGVAFIVNRTTELNNSK